MNATPARTIAAATLIILSLAGSLRADEAEDQSVRVIVKLGGKVTRDHKAEGKPVIKADLFASRVTDAELKELVC